MHELNISIQNLVSNKDLVFYIKYTHIRIQSFYNKLATYPEYDLELLNTEYDEILFQNIIQWPLILKNIEQKLDIHILFTYAVTLCQSIQSLLSNVLVINDNNILTSSRIRLLLKADEIIIHLGYIFNIHLPLSI